MNKIKKNTISALLLGSAFFSPYALLADWVDDWNATGISSTVLTEDWESGTVSINTLTKTFNLDLGEFDISGENQTRLNIYAGSYLTVNGNESIISGFNSTTDGGVFYILSTTRSINVYLDIDEISFTNNSSSNGGVIYNNLNGTYDTYGVINITNSEFVSNSASGSGGAIYNSGEIAMGNVNFTSNIATSTGGAIDNNAGSISLTEGTFTLNEANMGGAIFNGNSASLTLADVDFNLNEATESGGAICNWGELDLSDVTFYKNISTSTVDGGGAIYTQGGKDVILSNVDFNSNKSSHLGGAIYNYGSNIIMTGGSFDSNYATYYGGAVLNLSSSTSVNTIFTDVVFTNNSAGLYGGAICNYTGSITIATTEGTNLSYLNNYAGYSGGFLFSNGATNIFDIAENSSITIGDGTVGYDSISGNGSITKEGDGELVVNSSMASYSGSLSVNDGSMTVNNVLGATSITIESGATLTLGVSSYMATESTLLTGASSVSGTGTLNLVANVGANEGDYYTSTGEITFTNVYGGTLSGNVFTVAAANEDLYLGYEGEVTISAGSRVAIASESGSDETSVYLAFSSTESTSGTLNSVSDESKNSDFITAYTTEEATTENIISGAYYFDFTDLDVDSVLVSLYVGDESLTVYDFTIYHYDTEIGWDTTSDVSNVSYDGEYLSFEVTHFSGYGYSATSTSTIAVPEPSTYALIIGLCSLGFVVYRRRK